MKKLFIGDYLIAGEILVIGLAAVAHLAGVFLGWSFSGCAMLLGGCACAAIACGAVGWFLAGRRKGRNGSSRRFRISAGEEKGKLTGTERLMAGAFALLVVTQLVFICVGDTAWRKGDMTVETVGSFLVQDGIYRVNPMTGEPYTAGIPSRLKILCLPTLYGSLCKFTGLSPGTMVYLVIPIVTLFSSYTAFGLAAVSLFPEEKGGKQREKRICFMTIVSILIWVGAYQYGMDGFNLLCCGWRGVTVRNLVFLPWALSLCVRKRWLPAVLCIPGEACIVWTLYGFGVCLPFVAGMALTQWLYGKFSAKEKLPIKEKCGGRDDGISS